MWIPWLLTKALALAVHKTIMFEVFAIVSFFYLDRMFIKYLGSLWLKVDVLQYYFG